MNNQDKDKELLMWLLGAILFVIIVAGIIALKIMTPKESGETETTIEQTTEDATAGCECLKPIYEYSFMEVLPTAIVLNASEEATETTEAETTEPGTEPQFSGYDFIPLPEEFQVQVYDLCVEYCISFNIIMAVIKTESAFKMDIVGDKGNSIGLMQIQPRWWQNKATEYGLNIYEPIDNVHLGIIILTDMMKRNGYDLDKALKQYNSGNPHTTFTGYIDKVYANSIWLLEMGCDI